MSELFVWSLLNHSCSTYCKARLHFQKGRPLSWLPFVQLFSFPCEATLMVKTINYLIFLPPKVTHSSQLFMAVVSSIVQISVKVVDIEHWISYSYSSFKTPFWSFGFNESEINMCTPPSGIRCRLQWRPSIMSGPSILVTCIRPRLGRLTNYVLCENYLQL